MRVKHLSLTNFRGFERLELDLDRPVTVLVGVNGSGKTSVLRAIALLLEKRRTRFFSLPRFHSEADTHDRRVNTEGGRFAIVLRDGPALIECVSTFQTSPQETYQESLLSVGSPSPRYTFAFFAGTLRFVASADLERSSADDGTVRGADGFIFSGSEGYGRFIAWFKAREDVENERRVAARDFDLQDPQLRAVREAVAEVVPGFENLRIRRDPHFAMVVTKDGTELRLDQLSDGERNLVALAGDLARRMVVANPTSDVPRETEGVILIDEIEQHLHPGLQRKVIPALQRAFPNAQFIVTTHSPQVLSSVPASAVVVLDGFSATPVTAPTQGRDTNAILREVFGVTDRPQEERAELLAIAALIDDDQLDEARTRLASLAEKLSERDDEVLRLRTKLDFAEAGL
jgi:predicted ATP-binding protein involved in virulence